VTIRPPTPPSVPLLLHGFRRRATAVLCMDGHAARYVGFLLCCQHCLIGLCVCVSNPIFPCVVCSRPLTLSPARQRRHDSFVFSRAYCGSLAISFRGTLLTVGKPSMGAGLPLFVLVVGGIISIRLLLRFFAKSARCRRGRKPADNKCATGKRPHAKEGGQRLMKYPKRPRVLFCLFRNGWCQGHR